MTRTMNLLVFLLLVAVPFANGSSTLMAKLDSAYCTGDLTINLVSANCLDRCTFGSEVYLVAQVNATSDMPQQAQISVQPTLPNLHAGFFSVRETEVADICSSNSTMLTPPANNDAGYKCPAAGVYNVHMYSEIWGNPEAWYASTYGYNMGGSVRIYDIANEEEFATCYFDIMVQRGPNDYSFLNGSFLLPAVIGLTGLTAGFMFRKRRLGVVDLESSDEGTTTNFELIADPSTRV